MTPTTAAPKDLVEIGLMIAALPALFARKISGWRLLFYSQLVSIAYSVLSGVIVGGLLFGNHRSLHPLSGETAVSRMNPVY